MIKIPFIEKFLRKPIKEMSESEKEVLNYTKVLFETLFEKREETYGKPLKWIKASDIQPDDEWMQEDVWDEIYKQEDNLPDINVGNIKESEVEDGTEIN